MGTRKSTSCNRIKGMGSRHATQICVFGYMNLLLLSAWLTCRCSITDFNESIQRNEELSSDA